ncbi:MAG: hypothetical protein FWD91_06810, partial [Treponema sp.]|nr:hypothetical protein [Treponema sp.]
AGIWRPDWSFHLPPDAFTVNSSGISRITLTGEGVSLAVSYDGNGKLTEFPLLLNGAMAQVGVAFSGAQIYHMTVSFPSGETESDAETSWELEFLENDGIDALVRVLSAETWYFITLSRQAARITELWFDADGAAVGGFSYRCAAVGSAERIRSVADFFNPESPALELHYDSWGFPARLSEPDARHTVLRYRDGLPRFWEREAGAAPESLYLQWDANGLLFRMVRHDETAAALAEYRFKYSFDEKGNWIQRRELQMLNNSGYLFASPGAVFQRIVEYNE